MKNLTLLATLTLSLMVGCVLPDAPPMADSEPLGLMITPAQPVVPVGGMVQLRATAFYDNGETADITDSVRWSVMSGASTVDLDVDSGRLSALDEGTASVRINIGDLFSDPTSVRVTDAEVVGLSINPVHVELAEGEASWLSAMADFSDGTRGDFSGGVKWIVDDGDIASVAADGRVTALQPGDTQVRAEYDHLASSPSTITVFPYDETGDDDDAPVGDDDDAPVGDDDDAPVGDDDDDEPIDEPVGDPNLKITYFTAYVDDETGTTFYFIDVTNTGSGAAGAFYVDVFLDPWGEPEIGEDGDDWQLIDNLQPGETVYADFEIDDTPFWFTSWDSYATVDSTDEVVESNELDNIDGPIVVE